MFDATDAIPDPEVWPKKRKGNLSIERISFSQYRRRLINFAKFLVVEYLNGPEDIEKVVDKWLDIEGGSK